MVSFSVLRLSDYLTEGQVFLGPLKDLLCREKRWWPCLLLQLELAADAASVAAPSKGGTGPMVW